MKNLFDEDVAKQIQARLATLQPQTERLWGRMTVAQMVAHCARSLQWAVGEIVPDTLPLPTRLIGRLIKPLVFRGEEPLRKNTPTAKSLLVTDDQDFYSERDRLSGLIERFVDAGPAGCTTNPHSFFGKLTPEQWAIIMYKHLDHHLRQFGA